MLLTSAKTVVQTNPAGGATGTMNVTWTKTETTITAQIPKVAGITHFAVDTMDADVGRTGGTGTKTAAELGVNYSQDMYNHLVTLTGLVANSSYLMRAVAGDYVFPDQP
jgi:hypothetical protein